ncbi:MAG: arylsulfatase [Bacteroidales bacterium]|nr:arylsulfatase [Bacteroidales bacterium]
MAHYKKTALPGLTGMMATLTLPFMAGCQSEKAAPERPNIIYIMADDLGYGDLSCYGQRHFQTPNIDSLASRGMRFTQFYAGTAISAPSRCSLMTGKYTGHTRIRDNFSVTNQRVPLHEEDVTIAEKMKEAGYTAGMFGKWGLGELGTTGVPTKQGFDEFFGYINQRDAHSYYPLRLQHNEENIYFSRNENDGRGLYSHDTIHYMAKRFIRRNLEQGQPFVAFLTYTIPHAELTVPEDTLNPFIGRFEENPFIAGPSSTYRTQVNPRAAFAAMVTRLDAHVGEIIQILREFGAEENTIVIFTSDNGPHREGGGDPEFFGSSGGLRGIKADLYEGGIREPMIVCWPGHVAAGTESGFVGAFWDIMPTFCELAGVKAPADCDGISFLPTLRGKTQKNNRVLYWELRTRGAFKQAVRMGDMKAVRYGTTAPVQIYDLSSDLTESKDLAAERPDLVEKATGYFTSMRTENPDFPMQD